MIISPRHEATLERLGHDPHAFTKGLGCLSLAFGILSWGGIPLVVVSSEDCPSFLF